MIDIKEQARIYAAHVVATGSRSLCFFPAKKRENAQANEARRETLREVLRLEGAPQAVTGRHWGESEKAWRERLQAVAVSDYRYIVNTADPADYVRAEYRDAIKRAA